MGDKNHEIGFFNRRFPALHPVRDFSLPEDKNLIESHDAFIFLCGYDPDRFLPVQLVENMVKLRISFLGHIDPVISAFALDRIGRRHFVEAQVKAVNRFPGSDLNPGVFPGGAFPVSRIFPVRDRVNGIIVIRHADGASPGQVFRLVCESCRRQQKQRRKKNDQNDFPHISSPEKPTLQTGLITLVIVSQNRTGNKFRTVSGPETETVQGKAARKSTRA